MKNMVDKIFLWHYCDGYSLFKFCWITSKLPHQKQTIKLPTCITFCWLPQNYKTKL